MMSMDVRWGQQCRGQWDENGNTGMKSGENVKGGREIRWKGDTALRAF